MNPGTIQDFNIRIRITKSSSVYANKTSTIDVNVWPHVTLKDKLVSVFKSLARFHLPQSFEQGLACKKIILILITYSRVHKRWQRFFSKILEKPSIVQKKMLPHIKGLDFSQRWSKKKIQNGRLKKFKMAASKKPHFPAPPILNIFWWNSHGSVLGIVELIDAKGIGTAQLIRSWGCPT